MVYNDLYPRRLKNVYYPVYELDLDTGKWTEGIPLNLKLVRTVGGILNGRHYAGLGLSGDVNLKRNTYLYYFDNATSKWVGVAPVPVNKDSKEQQASSFIYNNRLYVMYKDSDKKYQLWEYKP
jgi:hypothetical protein